MTVLSDFRNRAKGELGISGASSERGFDDPSLDLHIARVAEELSLVAPVETTADVVVTGGLRTFALSGLVRPIAVRAVEYPLSQWPRALLEHDVWGGTAAIDHAPPSGNYTVRVYYEQGHLVDGSGSTVEAEHEGIVVVGVCAYALMARAAGAAQTFETATTQPATLQHLRLSQEWHRRYRDLLDDLRRARLRRTRLYRPGAASISRNVVSEI